MTHDRRPIPNVADAYRRITGIDPHATGKRVTNDEIAVRCVSVANHAHGDRTPSLHINRGKDTWVCRTCAAQGVLGGRSIELVIHAGRARDEKEALDFLVPFEDQKPKPPPPPPEQQRLAAEYDYRDATGRVLYQVRRFEWDLPDGGTDKTFSQRRKLDSGGWEARLGDVERVPYCYPEMVEAMGLGTTVYVVEGEKCADSLRAIGLCATTNAGGSAWKWTPEFVEFFRAATTVIVLGDNDEPGRAAARSRADMLANVCGSVRLLESLPGVDLKGDVVDWLDTNGNDVNALRRMVFEKALMVGAKLDDGSMTALHIWPLHQRILATQTAPLPGIQFGIEALDQELLGMHPSEVTILAARTNVGKTAMAEKIAMGASRTHKVLFYSLEMGAIRLHDRIAARCHGMKPKEYVRLGRPTLEDDLEWFNQHNLMVVGKCKDATVERMEELVAIHQPDLVIIDHLRHIKGWLGGGKQRADLAASKVMYELVEMAARRQTHMLLLHQLGRDADGSRPILSDLRDAGAVEETADNVLLLHRPFQHILRNQAMDPEFADNVCEVSLQKARDGGIFTTHLLWDGKNMEFRNPFTDEERLQAMRCCAEALASGENGRRRR
jgi:DnaB-like helicase C terminal domain